MTTDETQYTRVEYERRFLVSPQSNWKSFAEPYWKTFEDKYIRNTRLRLRILTDSDSGRCLIKLTKKDESPSPYFQTISRILLSRSEYEVFDALPGDRMKKLRHYHTFQGQVFSIDVFTGELEGLILCETEADGLDELMSVEFPDYAELEVTEDLFFTGGNLCWTTREELQHKLATFG